MKNRRQKRIKKRKVIREEREDQMACDERGKRKGEERKGGEEGNEGGEERKGRGEQGKRGTSLIYGHAARNR